MLGERVGQSIKKPYPQICCTLFVFYYNGKLEKPDIILLFLFLLLVSLLALKS